MSERANLLRELKEAQREINKYSTSRSSNTSEIVDKLVLRLGIIGIFFLFGIWIGYTFWEHSNRRKSC